MREIDIVQSGGGIREAENALFEKWALRRHPFATDGCADPEAFLKARYQIVFALKERNWRYSVEEQRELQSKGGGAPIDVREDFCGWWTDMAQWADVLLSEKYQSGTWKEVQDNFVPPSVLIGDERNTWISNRNKASLGSCACIQMKKSPGGGVLNKDDFFSVVKEDKEYLIRQLSIYKPHFIVSCGSGDSWHAFTKIVFENPEIRMTSNGINYFLVSLVDGHKTAVINFGHPSMRINGTLRGLLAFGLRDAIGETSIQLTD